MPYVSLFLALIFYGVATTLQKLALRFISLKTLLKIHAYIIFIVYVGIWFFFSKNFNIYDYFYPILGAISSALGFIFYYESLKVTAASIVSLITSIYAVVTILLSQLFLKEVFYWQYILGIIFIIVGLFFLYKVKISHISIKGFLFAFLAMILWGAWGFFSKLSYNYVGESEIVGSFGLFGAIIFLIYAHNIKEKKEKNIEKGEIIAIISIIVMSVASLSCYFSLKFFPASFAIPIISAYPSFTALSSFFVLKEPFNIKKILAFLLTIIGIIIFFLIRDGG